MFERIIDSSVFPKIIAHRAVGIFFSFEFVYCFHVYADPGKPRVIYSWIENKPDKTYYSLAINGHTIYRINYPEKLFKWYHVCQSWNGHTGEWQLWINSERVGRGFYNLVSGDAALVYNAWGGWGWGASGRYNRSAFEDIVFAARCSSIFSG